MANSMVNMSLVVGGEGDEVKDKKIIYQNQYVMNDLKMIIMNNDWWSFDHDHDHHVSLDGEADEVKDGMMIIYQNQYVSTY